MMKYDASPTISAFIVDEKPYTFVVGPTAHVDGNRATWTIDQQPTSRETVPNENVVAFSGWPGSTVFDADPRIQVRYEHTSGWWQSAWGTVSPAAGSAPATCVYWPP